MLQKQQAMLLGSIISGKQKIKFLMKGKIIQVKYLQLKQQVVSAKQKNIAKTL